MKFNRKWTVLVVVPTVLFGAFLVYSMVVQASYIYPTPETQSTFLKTYSPEHVTASFTSKRYSSRAIGGGSSAAGHTFATHENNFERYFVIQAKDWMPLMSAVANDVSSQLAFQHAQILYQTGDLRDGFHFDYKSGKTLGTVHVEPLQIVDPEVAIGHLTNGRPNTICPGEVAVKLRVTVREKWFKKEPGLITAKISTNPV